jgi:hypothetical protein
VDLVRLDWFDFVPFEFNVCARDPCQFVVD